MISPLWDMLFFIGTPVLCAALILPLRRVFSSIEIYAVVLAFVSFGHHLPGFMRAYGDPELFRQYRLRLVLAPVAAFVAFLYFLYHDLHGILLLLVLWDLWHLLMQHYGFMRIYDAKVGSTGKWTARLDFWMCVGWFTSIALWSPLYRSMVLSKLYESGAPLVPPWAFHAVLYGVSGVTLAVTALNVVHSLAAVRAGRPISSIKLVLHVLTTAFLYLVWIRLGDLYLGVAAFNVYHAVQYYAIVWIYNRGLVQRQHRTSRFLSFLFRQRVPLVLLYLLLIFSYGGLNYAGNMVAMEDVAIVLLAFGGTSTLMHYYFDGFIWKVRQPKTRQALAIDAEGANASGTTGSSGWNKSLVHATCFLLPIVLLALMERIGPAADAARQVEIAESIAAIAPEAVQSHTQLAGVYRGLGRWDRAVPALEDAVALAPHSAELHCELADAYQGLGRIGDARAAFRRALQLDPDHPDALFGLGVLLSQDGDDSAQQEAGECLRRAVAAQPDNPATYLVFGQLLAKQGRKDEALGLFDRAGRVLGSIEAQPAMVDMYRRLTQAYASIGELDKARRARDRGIALTAVDAPDRSRSRARFLVQPGNSR
jgi:tetratricopeptide (TPR) repeat protein